MDAEEDVEDFGSPRHGLHLSQGVVLLLRSEGAFHSRSPHSGELFPHEMTFVGLWQPPAFLRKVGCDALSLAQFTVLVARVAVVTCEVMQFHPEEPLVERDAMMQAGALIEGVEGELLDEGYPVDLYVVALGSELNVLVLLASHDRADVRLADADDSVGDALAGVTTIKVVALLAVDLSDDIDV